MTRTIEEADRVVARAEASPELAFKVFENFIFYPPIMKAKELIDAGAIGDPVTIRIKSNPGRSRTAWRVPPTAQAWRQDKDANGGGPIAFDDGHHKFAIGMHFMGQPEEVHAWIGSSVARDGSTLDAPAMISWKFAKQRLRGSRDRVFARSRDRHRALRSGRPGGDHRLARRHMGQSRPWPDARRPAPRPLRRRQNGELRIPRRRDRLAGELRPFRAAFHQCAEERRIAGAHGPAGARSPAFHTRRTACQTGWAARCASTKWARWQTAAGRHEPTAGPTPPHSGVATRRTRRTVEAEEPAGRAAAIAQAGASRRRSSGALPEIVTVPLVEALVLGLLKQGVRKYLAISATATPRSQRCSGSSEEGPALPAPQRSGHGARGNRSPGSTERRRRGRLHRSRLASGLRRLARGSVERSRRLSPLRRRDDAWRRLQHAAGPEAATGGIRPAHDRDGS